MEDDLVVKTIPRQKDKIIDGVGSILGKQFCRHGASRSLDGSGVGFVGRDGQGRRAVVGFHAVTASDNTFAAYRIGGNP